VKRCQGGLAFSRHVVEEISKTTRTLQRLKRRVKKPMAATKEKTKAHLKKKKGEQVVNTKENEGPPLRRCRSDQRVCTNKGESDRAKKKKNRQGALKRWLGRKIKGHWF